MSGPTDEDWSGTSDGAAAITARMQSTPLQRLEWLEEMLELAELTGGVTRLRAQRQREAEQRWTAT